MVGASRKLQHAQLTKLAGASDFIESAQQLHLEIADGAISIYTNGASPKYEASPAKSAPGGGYPRDPRSSKEIVASEF